jgi:hypothetical protein
MWTSEVQYESGKRKQTTGYSVLKRDGEYVGCVFTVLAQIIVNALNAPRPYVRVTISGGVGDVAQNASNIDVDILDFDNLKDQSAEDTNLSDCEWQYLKAHDAGLYFQLTHDACDCRAR